MKATLDEEKTVQQNVSEYDTIPINGQPRHVLGYLQDFLFPPERSRSLVKFLSGGERSRLLLAKLFTRPSNVLVLDEPTNDLDIETLELLESLLVDYQGTVLLVSHDRAFLNDVVTSTLAIETDGRVKEYDGGYDDYLRQRRRGRAGRAQDSACGVVLTAAASRSPAQAESTRSGRSWRPCPAGSKNSRPSSRELHDAMADPVFYRQDGGAIAESQARLEALESELAAAYERWEALEGLGG